MVVPDTSRPCPRVDLPFDDPIEAVERAFEAAETQFVVRAGRKPALDALANREVLRQGALVQASELLEQLDFR